MVCGKIQQRGLSLRVAHGKCSISVTNQFIKDAPDSNHEIKDAPCPATGISQTIPALPCPDLSAQLGVLQACHWLHVVRLWPLWILQDGWAGPPWRRGGCHLMMISLPAHLFSWCLTSRHAVRCAALLFSLPSLSSQFDIVVAFALSYFQIIAVVSLSLVHREFGGYR